MKTCDICGREFVPKPRVRHHQKYCGEDCAREAQRRCQRAWKRANHASYDNPDGNIALALRNDPERLARIECYALLAEQGLPLFAQRTQARSER